MQDHEKNRRLSTKVEQKTNPGTEYLQSSGVVMDAKVKKDIAHVTILYLSEFMCFPFI